MSAANYNYNHDNLPFSHKIITSDEHILKRRMFLESLYCKKQRIPIYLKKPDSRQRHLPYSNEDES